MRMHLLLLALAAGCGSSSDKTAKHFCQNVRITFGEMAVVDTLKARQGLKDIGTCSDINEASQSLRSTVIAFKAAAIPFRDRAEVGQTLDALEKLTLDELGAVRCSGERVSADQVESLRKSIDSIETKLAAVVAACP